MRAGGGFTYGDEDRTVCGFSLAHMELLRARGTLRSRVEHTLTKHSVVP